ncbi:MAG TPA: lipid-A-disaccharide synthase [Geminicoccaceae bacterium]|nr:lipid-A-disaccharide synthase [Geminicoccaceae bacterium]
MQALRRQGPDGLGLAGIGGPCMRSHGLQSVFPMEELARGPRLTTLPRRWRRLVQTTREVDRRRPDLVLTIDAPDFALRLQRRLAGRPVVRVHYGVPQILAWQPTRAARLARDLDHLLALLPFEPALLRRHGLPCSFVGHPIFEETGVPGEGARFRRRYQLPPDPPLLCLLPGRSEREITRHLPLLEQAVALIWRQIAQLRLVLPTTARMAPLVKRLVGHWRSPVLVLEDRAERFDAYDASWLAIAASGAAALETALAGLPSITIYRTAALTPWLARRLIPGPQVNPVNLILGRPAVPELLQEDCRPDRIAAAALRLLGDEALRQDQQAALAEAVTRLRGDDERPPSQRAAARILELLADRRNERRTP